MYDKDYIEVLKLIQSMYLEPNSYKYNNLRLDVFWGGTITLSVNDKDYYSLTTDSGVCYNAEPLPEETPDAMHEYKTGVRLCDTKQKVVFESGYCGEDSAAKMQEIVTLLEHNEHPNNEFQNAYNQNRGNINFFFLVS